MSKKIFGKLVPLLVQKQQELGRKLRIMEVCGTHTLSFSKTGVRDLLSPYVELISGPGCPVCVTNQSDIDQMIAYAEKEDIIVTTFGDMMKVPGSRLNLYQERANGADVRVVHSPSEAVELAKKYSNKKIVFLGVGFETTAPSVAVSIKRASVERVNNYFVYSAHKLTPPALCALLEDSTHQLDGFLLPGHVSVIIGRKGWTVLEEKNVPAVIGGFEPVDLLTSIYLIANEMNEKKRLIRNNYPRFVREEGNVKAQNLLKEVFSVCSVKWRGFGTLPYSGMEMHANYQQFDAKKQFAIEPLKSRVIKGCRCGEIVKGKEKPFACKLFAKVCTPENPLGPCMVSSEGTCFTYYQYEQEKESVGM
ncbi:hydrogenase formation protein HypD [Laceyella putida]